MGLTKPNPFKKLLIFHWTQSILTRFSNHGEKVVCPCGGSTGKRERLGLLGATGPGLYR